MKRITSRQNPVVMRYRRAARGDDDHTVLLDGVHVIEEALASDVPISHAIVASDALGRPDIEALVTRLDRHHIEIVAAPRPVMAAVSPVRSPSAAVALARRPADRASDLYRPPALAIIACDVQDAGNIGAIVRVAEAAGASGVVAAGACADPFSWKALRGSMGSALRLPVVVRERPETAMLEARAAGCRILATVPRGGMDLAAANLSASVALLVGGEGTGLPANVVALADDRLTIPMKPPVESLNAAVTAAVALYEAYRQRTVPAER
jgi:TrmH family RNA methyltransferase